MKKKYKFVIPALLLLITAAISLAVMRSGGLSSPAMLTVAGLEVDAGELSLVMKEHIAEVSSYFAKEHGTDVQGEMWYGVYGGECPIEMLKELAAEELLSMKTEQKMFLEYGIVQDVSFSSFLTDLEQENAGRKETVSRGGVVYGPVEYGPREYYYYLHSMRLQKLYDLWVSKGMVEDGPQFIRLIEEEAAKSGIIWNDRAWEQEKRNLLGI